ncbi:MAG: hypothetical protein WAV76_06170 [Bacteroidota bacterium]
MISTTRLGLLKQLFKEDGIDLSDRAALEIGTWLIERVKSIRLTIPPGKEVSFQKYIEEMKLFRALYKSETVRNDDMEI